MKARTKVSIVFFPHRCCPLPLLKDAVYNSQEVKLRFMGAMHSIAKVTGKAVATAFDLSRFKTACDLGGERRIRGHAKTFCTEKRWLQLFLPLSHPLQDAPALWRTSSPKPSLS